MGRLSDEARQQRLYKLMRLCYLRAQDITSEDQIVRELDFRDALGTHSAVAMYEELEAWGLPRWLVYPRGADARAGEEETERREKERRARATGEAKDLPPAGQAVSLFREDLERRAHYIDELPGLKEQLQAERFVWSLWIGEDWEYFP